MLVEIKITFKVHIFLVELQLDCRNQLRMRAWLTGVVLLAVLVQLVVTLPQAETDRNELLDYLLQAYENARMTGI